MFYLPVIPAAGAEVRLDPRESRHAAGARRLRPGDELRLFDGLGTLALAVVRSQNRNQGMSVEIRNQQTTERESGGVHLASAVAKGERQRVLLDMATQLGIRSYHPLLCRHSVVKPGSGASSRWQGICIDACKQSGQLFLPVLHRAEGPDQVRQWAKEGDILVVIAHPSGQEIQEWLLDRALRASTPILAMVGPEGGFTEEEVDTLQATGAWAVSLGNQLLRIETAAVTMINTLQLRRSF